MDVLNVVWHGLGDAFLMAAELGGRTCYFCPEHRLPSFDAGSEPGRRHDHQREVTHAR